MVTTLFAIATAVAGFASSHKGAPLPIAGLTVGGLMATVSSWRFVQTIEHAVDAEEGWVEAHVSDLSQLRNGLSVVQNLLPLNLNKRLVGVENGVQAALNTKPSVDTGPIVDQVLSTLARVAAPAAAVAAAPAPVPDVAGQDVVAPATVSFVDPPVGAAVTN
jgi:hypothetical protein